MRVIIGAGKQRWEGWTPTQQADLDLTDPSTFAAYFGQQQADAFLCEHVWEHLHLHEAEAAARLVFEYLKPGGYLRVAVPDGRHPSAEYRSLVGVHGPGPAADHQVLYTLETFVPVFEQAGFFVKPLEWWDAVGEFHHLDWKAEDGPIYRSSQMDHRNADWRGGKGELGFTSLMVDAVKPEEP